MTAGHSTNLLTGLAAYIAAGGIGASYSTSGAYTSLQTGIVLGSIPQQPDRIITLTTYGVEDSPALSDSIVGVQVRTRMNGQDKRLVDDLDDAVFNLLHGLTNVTLTGGVTIVQMLRQSSGTLGQDETGRWSDFSNYYATTWRPSTHRI